MSITVIAYDTSIHPSARGKNPSVYQTDAAEPQADENREQAPLAVYYFIEDTNSILLGDA